MDSDVERLDNVVKVLKEVKKVQMSDWFFELTGLSIYDIPDDRIEEEIRTAVLKRNTDDKLFSPVHLVYQYAQRDGINLIITGETGTGKELLAKLIHNLSPRKGNGFIAVNASQFPESLFESEMFGYTKNAFTGAFKDRDGLLKSADKGTFFIDELGKMPEGLQAKLLRVIEDKELRPVGSVVGKPIDVRFIAAFKDDESVDILQDLKYRLGYPDTFALTSFKERLEDAGANRNQLIDIIKAGVIKKIKPQRDNYILGKDFVQAILNRKHEGNFREVENLLRAAIIYADAAGSDTLSKENIPDEEAVNERRHITLSKIGSIDHFDFIHQIEKKNRIILTLDMEKIKFGEILEYINKVKIIILKYMLVYMKRNHKNYKESSKDKDIVKNYSSYMRTLDDNIEVNKSEWLKEYFRKFGS